MSDIPVPPTASRRALRVALVVALLAVLVLAGRQVGGELPRFAEWVKGLGALGPIVFIAGYAVLTVAFVPGSLLTLAAGAVFGPWWGTLWVMFGATLGATLSFLVARHVARAPIERRLAGNARFAAIDSAVGRQGFRMVLLLRISPVFPFNLLNYGLGLTRVRLRDYVLASVGMIPGTLLYVYQGKVAGDVAALAGGASSKGLADWLLLGGGLLATVAVTWMITRAARAALKQATAGAEGEGVAPTVEPPA